MNDKDKIKALHKSMDDLEKIIEQQKDEIKELNEKLYIETIYKNNHIGENYLLQQEIKQLKGGA